MHKSVAEKMLDALISTPRAEQGTPCLQCNATALACQYGYLLTDDWCCELCRAIGGYEAHR